MATGDFNSGGGQWTPPIGFVWLSTENISPAIYFENTTWELISQNRVLMGAGDGHNGGETVEAGLPNITGYINTRPTSNSDGSSHAGIIWDKENGALSSKVIYDAADSSGAVSTSNKSFPWGSISFDASKSNAIYGKSITVQPPAFYVYMWRRAS